MTLSIQERDGFIRRLEKEGLRKVRIEWANGEYQNKGSWLPLVLEWIRIKEFEGTYRVANRAFYISACALFVSVLTLFFK